MKHEKNQKPGKSLENVFLLTLFLCGAVGAFYFFNQGNRSLEKQSSGHWKVSEQRTSRTENAAPPSLPQLMIEGIPEAGLPIRFAVPQSTQDVRYVLDLGNGEKVALKDGTYQYTYRKPGTYRVQLQLIRGGEPELIHSEFLNIEAGVEVAVGNL